MNDWVRRGIAKEWRGRFARDSNDTHTNDRDFFGFPSKPPFYVGCDGINGVTQDLLARRLLSSALTVYEGTRVSGMERDKAGGKWRLFGTAGDAAFHDTDKSVA